LLLQSTCSGQNAQAKQSKTPYVLQTFTEMLCDGRQAV